MFLYDTAAGAIRQFEPRDGRATIYVCGITPYDAAHLGHVFTYLTFDVLTRRLRSLGVEVAAARNITDVDDDMLRIARERGGDYLDIGNREVERFDTDLAALHMLPVAAPRATAFVDDIARWVAQLQDAGFAYDVDGWVFFDVAKFPDYGNLSHYNRATMLDLSRERGADPDDRRKRDSLDFVLWQRSATGEPSWDSRWGPGRPGWHIECSVMSSAELGTPIDIHGGGDDLIYPHHESEIAQSEALGAAPFVRQWMHVAMVKCHDQKMSKSLGNLVFARDLLEIVSGATIRLMLAAHHYRESWNYDNREVAHAETRREAYAAAMQSTRLIAPDAAAELYEEFLERIDDDLDTAGALGVLDLVATAFSRSAAADPSETVSALGAMGPMLDMLGALEVGEPARQAVEAAAQLGC